MHSSTPKCCLTDLATTTRTQNGTIMTNRKCNSRGEMTQSSRFRRRRMKRRYRMRRRSGRRRGMVRKKWLSLLSRGRSWWKSCRVIRVRMTIRFSLMNPTVFKLLSTPTSNRKRWTSHQTVGTPPCLIALLPGVRARWSRLRKLGGLQMGKCISCLRKKAFPRWRPTKVWSLLILRKRKKRNLMGSISWVCTSQTTLL